MEYNELQKHLEEIMNEQNNRSIDDFEGYSPKEMHHILHLLFEESSPITLRIIKDSDYTKSPMFNLVKYFLSLVDSHGEIKLTAKGFLPTKIVKQIYNQGYWEEDLISEGITKLYKESDTITVNLTKILAEIARLTKKRKGKLSLTKKGKELVTEPQKLFNLIFTTMVHRFNWGYYDGYNDDRIGKFGFGFTLILLSKYGERKHLDQFYAAKYMKSFPFLVASVIPNYGTAEEYIGNCYSIRTFERFMCIFGLVKAENQGKIWSDNKYIIKTDLFDKLIKVAPPKHLNKNNNLSSR